MAEHGNRAGIIAEALCQIRRKRVGAPAQLGIGEASIATNVCDCMWRHCGPVIDSFDQIH